jgi:hypothetical protein
MNALERVKLFAMSLQMLDQDLADIENKYAIDLGLSVKEETNDKDEEYYPQFDQAVRNEASEMAAHYELFYCLENSLRGLICEKMEAQYGAAWWDQQVPETVRKEASDNRKRELDMGVTRRSVDDIDYVTFGQLGDVVRSNWQTFADTFNSQSAFSRIMTSLNQLRAPIAHCSPLADDEIVRLRLTLRDWFRLMS